MEGRMRRKTGILVVGSLVSIFFALGATRPNPVPLVLSDLAELAVIRLIIVVGGSLLADVPAVQAILVVALVWACAGLIIKTVFLRK